MLIVFDDVLKKRDLTESFLLLFLLSKFWQIGSTNQIKFDQMVIKCDENTRDKSKKRDINIWFFLPLKD